MSIKSKYFDKKINHRSYSVPYMAEDLNEVGPFVHEKLDVTSERGLFLWYTLLLSSNTENSRSFS